VQSLNPVPLIGVASTWDKLRHIPSQTWINLGICVLAIVLIVRTWRMLKKFNDYAPWIGAALVSTTIMAYWIYERAEPRFLTPVVERLADFLPTKAKHEAELEKMRESRN